MNIVYEHRLRQGLTNNYPNTELWLIRLGFLSNGSGVKSLHTVPNSLYAQQYVSLYPAIAVDNSANPNVNTPATIAWQNYLPSVSDGIKVCEANLVNGSFVFGAQHTFAAGQPSNVKNRRLCWMPPTTDTSRGKPLTTAILTAQEQSFSVILYKALPSYNDPPSPITKFLYYDGKTAPSIGFANGTVSLVWDYSAGTCYGATRSASGSWGAWQSFLGEEPRLMQTGTKQIAHAKANSSLFDVKLTLLSSGSGGSAQERGLSGGGKGGERTQFWRKNASVRCFTKKMNRWFQRLRLNSRSDSLSAV